MVSELFMENVVLVTTYTRRLNLKNFKWDYPGNWDDLGSWMERMAFGRTPNLVIFGGVIEGTYTGDYIKHYGSWKGFRATE